MIESAPLLLGSDGYNLNRSVRLRSSATAYFERTPAGSGSLTAWTWSGWVKRGALGGESMLFSAGTGTSNPRSLLSFNATNDTLDFGDNPTGSAWAEIITTQVFRDPAAWYHIVAVYNSANATSTDRMRLYVNGNRITTFNSATYPAQNTNSVTNTAIVHRIGRYAGGAETAYFDGYMTEVNFIGGQALTPTSFGEFNLYNQWVPKKYSGSYGTNGFYLNFNDNSGVTATTIGKDNSGLSNNWTPNNISVTAGSTYDSMKDVPTLTSATAANYAVLNTLDKHTNVTISNANLSATFSAYTGFIRSTFALPSTGQWYWEGTVPTSDVRAEFGIATFTQAISADPQGAAGCWVWYSNGTNSFKYNAGTSTSWGTAWASGDIIGIAFDAGAGTLTYYKNGTLQGGGAAATGLTGTYSPMVGFGNATSTAISINFGQRPFAYTPPTGFIAINSFNM